LHPDEHTGERSLGDMLDAAEPEVNTGVTDRRIRQGKFAKITVHGFVAFKGAGRKTVRVGRVTNISKAAGEVVLHRYKPVSDGRMRVKWEPVFIIDGQEVLSQGNTALLETVPFSKIMMIVQLNDGTMSHAAARRLDTNGYMFEGEAVVNIVMKVPQKVADSTAIRVEDFMRAVGYVPECEEDPAGVAWLNDGRAQRAGLGSEDRQDPRRALRTGLSSRPKVVFESIHVMQKWLSSGDTDFLEIYCGWQQLTYRVREVGLQAADGIDLRVVSHGRTWALGNPVADAELAWLICIGLKPRATHAGTPCTEMSVLGKQQLSKESEAHVILTLEIMDHQESRGLLASHENPKGSTIFKRKDWIRLLGFSK
jgi:hypothetical protein